MELSPRDELLRRLNELDDPRVDRHKLHHLVDILMIGFCTMLAGGEGWEDMEWFGESKQEWFAEFLSLPNGIPSADTFGRVFSALKPAVLEEMLVGWLLSLKAGEIGGQIALDGKTLRASFNQSEGQSPLHLLNALATETGLILGQRCVSQKSNEIEAIPPLLQLLELRNQVVTVDAIGCQTAIAQQIVEQGGDYVLALKGNQPKLHAEVSAFFQAPLPPELAHWVKEGETTDADHGRVEERRYRVCEELD